MSFSTSIFSSKVQSALKMQERFRKFCGGASPRTPTPPEKKKWNLSLQKFDVIFDRHTKIPRSAPDYRQASANEVNFFDVSKSVIYFYSSLKMNLNAILHQSTFSPSINQLELNKTKKSKWLNFRILYALTSSRRLPPLSDQLCLTFRVVAYKKFDCIFAVSLATPSFNSTEIRSHSLP